MHKCYIVGGDRTYLRPFREILEQTDSLEEADVCMFTGGEDVTPSYYGEKTNFRTYNNSDRDFREWAWWVKAKELKIPCIGICRGSQFLTVMNGGKLYQHVDNHCESHHIITYDDKEMVTSSTHHQMMRPAGNFMLLAYCHRRSERYITGMDLDGFKDPPEVDVEVVWYPDTQCLCIQGHPEIMRPDDPFVKWCAKEVAERILSKKEKAVFNLVGDADC